MLEQSESVNAIAVSLRPDTTRNDPLRYLDDVVRYAFARLGSQEEAEDVAMEVFQAAFRFRSTLAGKADPKLYLIGITRRKIADHLRSRRRQRGPNTVSLSDPGGWDVGYEIDETVTELVEALSTLPELQRDVLILKYLLGFSTEEVADLIRKSPQAANSQLQRAREALAKNAPHLAGDSVRERSQL